MFLQLNTQKFKILSAILEYNLWRICLL